MGFVGDMLGTQNKAKASGQTVSSGVQDYQTVKNRDLQTGVDQKQVNIQSPFSAGATKNIQGQTANSIGQQQAFVNAAAAQNGLGNQGNAYNQQMAMNNALAGQNGVGNQSSVFGQQQNLANQLQDQAMGGGPNPALAQLSQATNNNIKNQAALMASQRGGGQNAGLLAKQAAEQGSEAQQQAAGQAATLRAQQQLSAQQQLQAQQAQMGQLATQQVGQQSQGINAAGQLANQQVANQIQGLNSLGQMSLANQQQMLGSNLSAQGMQLQQAQGYNNLNAQMAQQQNQIAAGMAEQGNSIRAGNAQATASNNMAAQGINAQVAGQNAQSNAALAGGLLGAGGGVMAGMASGGTGLFAYKGGEIPRKFAGGGVAPWGGAPVLDVNPNAFSDAMSKNFGSIKAPAGKGKPASSLGQRNYSSTSGEDSYQAPLGFSHELPPAPAAVNQGVDTQPRSWDPNTFGKAAGVSAAHGGSIGGKLKSGGGVPGKAKVSGDSLKNDNVKALLSPGEIVIPRSITQGKDAPRKAAEFVASILARKGK